jgi:hypothetical protein
MMAQLLFQVDVEGIKDAENNSDLEEESYLKMINARVNQDWSPGLRGVREGRLQPNS